MQVLFAEQGLYISELLGFNDDCADEEGPNDIDISLMESNMSNKDFTTVGSEYLQCQLRSLIEEYGDIFSYSSKVALWTSSQLSLG